MNVLIPLQKKNETKKTTGQAFSINPAAHLWSLPPYSLAAIMNVLALQGSWDLTCSGVDLSESEKKVSHSFNSIALSQFFNIWMCIRTERYAEKPLCPRKHIYEFLWNSSGNPADSFLLEQASPNTDEWNGLVLKAGQA